MDHTRRQPPDQCLGVYSTHPFAELQDHRSQSTAERPKGLEQLANKSQIMETRRNSAIAYFLVSFQHSLILHQALERKYMQLVFLRL